MKPLHTQHNPRAVWLRLALCVLFAGLLYACCNDQEVRQLQMESSEHAAELMEMKDASLSYVFIEYERNLDNTLLLAGHCWDKTLSLYALAILLGLLLGFRLLVKTVPFLYKWLDGNPEIGLNTICLVSISLSCLSLLDNPFNYWWLPTFIALCGIGLMVVTFFFPNQTGWLSNRWFKYLRWLYVAAFVAFVILCFFYNPELPTVEE